MDYLTTHTSLSLIRGVFALGVIWYFDPHGKLSTGSIFIHDILKPLLKLTPLYGKVNPHGILTPIIFNQKIYRESKYHG